MANDGVLLDKWRREFGPNFVFKGLFSVRELHTSDTKAISHIVTRPNLYQKSSFNLYASKQFLGPGLLGVELEDHRRQVSETWLPDEIIILKSILSAAEDPGDYLSTNVSQNAYLIPIPRQNPAFSVAQIRHVSDISVEKAIKLRDIWSAQFADNTCPPTIEVLSWLRRMTLDVIGEAGFNYYFHNLDDKPSELNDVFTQLFHSPTSQRDNAFRLVQAMIPILRLVPVPGRQLFRKVRAKMVSIGRELVEQSKIATSKETTEAPLSGRRDILSLLVKANMAADIPDRQRLSDEEVIGQIPTFFLAGHETTSVATAWALHSLSLNQKAQMKLREEVLAVPTDTPTMDELNNLVYLEWVVRENMRVNSPVVSVTRMAMEDDVLPLSKPYIDKNGAIHETLPIRKGQTIHVPISAVNTDKDIWGPDAQEFRPERWENVPKAVQNIPGMWANLLTFFAGPHNCIGFRFTLVEQKALLFTLIRAFEFENAIPEGGIGRTSTPLRRPIILADKNKTGRMPLIVKRYTGC
ncbi:hypothetical protein MSAN_00404000 [Mycena sanguinolenta]|uniref:Cytochrome P450 n=1 Tax=Mycena sanguinolenta TaxID=230812 RepID=A0A8H7DH33_9AGAR|nr:hypothetical protein MSAN_00404000 [Mycena sanguinolenta]